MSSLLKLGKVARTSEFAVVRWSVPWLWADFVHVSRFIDEIVVILTDNDVTAQDHLKTLKFEYLAWPEKVSGASLLVALHMVVYALAGVGMKKAFICEALKEYALAFPDPRQQVASVPALGAEAGTVASDELRFVCSCGFVASLAKYVCGMQGAEQGFEGDCLWQDQRVCTCRYVLHDGGGRFGQALPIGVLA